MDAPVVPQVRLVPVGLVVVVLVQALAPALDARLVAASEALAHPRRAAQVLPALDPLVEIHLVVVPPAAVHLLVAVGVR
jgi:hypothetical protein